MGINIAAAPEPAVLSVIGDIENTPFWIGPSIPDFPGCVHQLFRNFRLTLLLPGPFGQDFGKKWRNRQVVTVAATASAMGSDRKVAGADTRAGSRSRQARNTLLRNMEQNRASRTWPRAVVSSTRGYWTARGRIMAVKHLNIAHRLLRQLRIAGEEAHKHRGQGVGEHHHPRAEGEAQAHDALDGLFDTLQVAGAVVEADHRLGAQGEAAHGHGDEEQVALHDGGAGDQGVPLLRAAVPLEHRVEHDEQDAVGGDDQKGGTGRRRAPAA